MAGRHVRKSPTVWERRAAKAEAEAFQKSFAGQQLREVERRLAAIENLLNNLRGEEGIEVALPVIKAQKKNSPSYRELDLPVCDPETGEEKIYTFLIR